MWSRLYPHGVTTASGVWHGRPLWDPRFRFFFLDELQIRSFPQIPKTGADFCVCLWTFPHVKGKADFYQRATEKRPKDKKKNPPAVSLPRWCSLHMLHLLQDPGWIRTATGPGRHSLPVWLSSSCCYQWATIKQQVRPSCVCFHVLCSR